MIDPTNDILDQIKDLDQPTQTETFKQRMHTAVDGWILDEAQKKQSGLSYYMQKFRYAIPVAALLLLVTGTYFFSGVNNNIDQPTIVLTATDTTAQTDPEMQEIISLAFAFEATSDSPATSDSDSTVKTTNLMESDMLLAYLRK